MSRFTEKIKKFPASPGIYLFYNKKRELIYVGKATSLRDRVRSYFALSPIAHLGPARPVEAMIHEVTDIKIIKTDSVLEAVILEGKYIKKFLPKYNVDWKDDKSWNYLVVTNEKFPRLLAVREREINKVFLNSKNKSTSPNPLLIKEGSFRHLPLDKGESVRQQSDRRGSVMKQWKFIFGPFPSLNTRETLKILHKLFYISRCQSVTTSARPKGLATPPLKGGDGRKPCFDYQIGNCLGVCIGEISAHDYERKVVKPLVAFLSGEKKRVIMSLNNTMKTAAKNENFEEAGRLRNQISALKHIQDVTLLNKEFYNKEGNKKLETGYQKLKNMRIEAYDISNLGDSGKVGSMVVFDESGPIKSEYKKFKIRTVAGQSDVDCLKEVLTRRLNHVETPPQQDFGGASWKLPDLILVDGGAPQVNAVVNVLQENKIDLPVIGIAKGAARKKNEFVFGKNSGSWQNWVWQNGSLLISARDEAHRFAIAYQKKLRKII